MTGVIEKMLKEKRREEDIERALVDLCHKMPDTGALQFQEDAVRICTRVAVVSGPDVIDALSTGDDIDTVCMTEGTCTETRTQILAGAKRRAQQLEEADEL